MPDPSWTWRLSTLAYRLDVNVDDEGILPAENVPYDNATSGLTAADVQAAIDELAAGGGSGDLDAAVFGYLAHGNTGASETFDASVAGWHSATLNAATVTATFSGATTGEAWSLLLELTQDATGGRLVTWPGSVVWPGGVAPTLSTAAGATDILTFFTRDGGTTWFGFQTGGGSGASDAEDVSIADAGGYFTGTDVEAALQEIAAGSIGYWEPVTNGDAMFPEIVFDDGDVVMEWVPG